MKSVKSESGVPTVSAPTSPLAEQLIVLAELYPQVFTEGKIDFDKLRTLLGSAVETRPERYSFSWAGKRQAIEQSQVPSQFTLLPMRAESVNFDSTDNLFIEGNNLEVLKLLRHSYFNAVRVIYIDPPYNTGNDFVYPDDFTDAMETYLQITGQKDAEGKFRTSNPETSGRYHSAWLSMMYPRLVLARSLLTDEGVILVSIDDHEVHDLRLLMNEIFGEDGFLACFIWHRRQMPDSRNLDRVSTDHEYVLAYRKQNAVFRGTDIDIGKYQNHDNDLRGPWFSADLTGLATRDRRPNLHYEVTNPKTGITYPPSPTRGWSCGPDTFQRYIAEDRILWPAKPEGRPRLKKFLSEVTNFQTGFSSMLDVGYTTEGTRTLQELFGDKVLPFAKPVSLIKTLVQQATGKDDVILDFFAGSCTTAQAVLELNREDGGNRRFIMVQLPEPTTEDAESPGTGYRTIADIGKERIRRVIARMQQTEAGTLNLSTRQTPEDLGFRVFKQGASNRRRWSPPAEDTNEGYLQQLELMASTLTSDSEIENVIWEEALREGYSLSSQIVRMAVVTSNQVYQVTDPSKGQFFYICLDDRLDRAGLQPLALTRNTLVICRARSLDDTTGANLALMCRLRAI